MSINNLVKVGTFTHGYNNTVVTIGRLKLYFSYQTIIAFEDNGVLVVSENIFSRSTGTHINAIERNRTQRFKRDVFELHLETMLVDYNIW